ncbi:MAG: MarR family transcriptional regulator [Acidobacteria bacterium]|nr:MarR family transcriptional regulator [Acidobacteriota bacterium]
MRLRGAYLTMHRTVEFRFAPLDATADQFVLLKVLNQQGGITQKELARRMFSDPNTIAAMVALLEKRNLIRRKIHAQDGRSRRVYLTAAGRRLLGLLVESCEDLRQKLEECFPRAVRVTVLGTLERVAEVMTNSRSTGRPEEGSGKSKEQNFR